MNGKPASGSFRRRIYWYVVITAVVQFLLGIMYAITAQGRGAASLSFLLIMFNFAYLLLYNSSTGFTSIPAAIIVGTFFMFLMIAAIGEFFHQIGTISVPPDPLEEARRSSR